MAGPRRLNARQSPRLVILGKQGAGKGTQAERLARHYGIPRISTGDMFRTAVALGTEAGLQAKKFMEQGELVPDDVVIGVVELRLTQDDAQDGFVLDGFPRTREQALALDRVLEDGVDLAVSIEVPTEEVLRRLADRRVCLDCGAPYSSGKPPAEDAICDVCGGPVVQRQDDKEAAIKRRLDLYIQQTEPLISYYMNQDKLASVDGTGPADTVTARLLRGIEARLRDRN